ncbi:OmpA family protein [Phaeovibrio sulfidiphilus]|uniref:OmpA family protein n=1 Tax=Phaeovibrio sulfidiphilus TaxID=1220600 RepID=A0A8J6YLE5_9PROT|nr:OmpA family protein [Phaeovibrio sulfidiphilus]MBE1236545.1 OmpA family protein [Phaeovibrio sulfidiphilus]
MVKRLAIGVAAAALLTGCASSDYNWITEDPWDYEAVSQMPCTGTAFDAALMKEYVALADYEYGGQYSGGDWASVEYYTGKAKMAAQGRTPSPTDPATLETGSLAPELAAARAELVRVLASGVTSTNPDASAKAQVSFDCWTEEAAENRQPIRIQECRADYEEAMIVLRGSPTGIHFATGSTAVDREGVRTIETAVALYNTSKANSLKPRLVVTGYTDTVGSEKTNLALSQRRAEAVVKALVKRGVPQSAIVVRAKGEADLAVATGENVANRLNRRVEITLEQ